MVAKVKTPCRAATLGHGEAIYDLMLHYKHNGEHSEALYWAKRGTYWAKRVGDDYFWKTACFIPVLEKLYRVFERC